MQWIEASCLHMGIAWAPAVTENSIVSLCEAINIATEEICQMTAKQNDQDRKVIHNTQMEHEEFYGLHTFRSTMLGCSNRASRLHILLFSQNGNV